MLSRLTALAATSPPSAVLLLVACAYLLVIAVWLSVIDLRSHLLPNRIVYPSILLAILLLATASGTAADLGSLLRTIFAALALGGGYLVLRLIYPAGMGLGDVKLAVVLGAYLGYLSWGHLFYATVLTFLLGGLTGVVLILSRKGSAKSAIPFGPFMFAGTIVALLIPV